jgi:hypothetical protein
VARRLRELIAALDRRVPHLERAGEASIAEDAARLRTQAVRRLDEMGDCPPPAGGTVSDAADQRDAQKAR